MSTSWEEKEAMVGPLKNGRRQHNVEVEDRKEVTRSNPPFSSCVAWVILEYPCFLVFSFVSEKRSPHFIGLRHQMA
jgi:hypothetical protein